VDTSTATIEPGEPVPTCALVTAASVWYRYTPAADEDVVIDTFDADYDTVVAVYTGTGYTDFEQQACNDQSGVANASRVDVHVYGGTMYFVQVSGYLGDAGNLVLRVSHPGAITGTARDAGGEPVAGLCVTVYGPSVPFATSFRTVTTSSGTYEAPALIPGDYRVEFALCNSYDEYFHRWYDGANDADDATVVSVADGRTVDGIDVTVVPTEPEPEPEEQGVDLAVTSLSVVNDPIRTDGGSTGAGYVRHVTVGFSDLDDVDADKAELWVEACADTYGGCVMLGDEIVSVRAGETSTRTYRWDGLGQLGDMRIQAFIRPCADPDLSNNGMTVEHYVLVGGTGFGFGASDYVQSARNEVFGGGTYYPYLDCPSNTY
jgi:hypothetical protein